MSEQPVTATELAALSSVPSDVPEWAQTIIAQNVRILATFDEVLAIAETLKTEVGPIVESLSASPMFRMIAGGKK